MVELSTFKTYQYDPSIPAAGIFCGAFALVTAVMVYQFGHAYRICPGSDRKKIRTLIPFLIGGLLELLGFAARIWSGRDVTGLTPYIIQSLFILLAPVFFAATIYMTLGRIIAILGAEHLSFIPLRWLTKIFVSADILCFILQGAGGGLLAALTSSMTSLGEKIIIIGLFVQIGFFGIFILVLGLFQIRIHKSPTTIALVSIKKPCSHRNWNTILLTLSLCSIFILIRSIVRAIEYLQGWQGYIISHEVYLYTLDALLMFLNMAFLALQNLAGFYATYRMFADLALSEAAAFGEYEENRKESYGGWA